MTRTRVGTRIRTRPAFLLLGAGLLAACEGTESPTPPVVDIVCDLDNNLLFASLAPNAIPAINNPPLVDPDDVSVDYLFDTDKVLGVVINGEARAYPINQLTGPRREIINDVLGELPLAATW